MRQEGSYERTWDWTMVAWVFGIRSSLNLINANAQFAQRD